MHMKILWRNDGETRAYSPLEKNVQKAKKEQTPFYSPSFYLILFFAEAIIKIAKSKGKNEGLTKRKAPSCFRKKIKTCSEKNWR